MVPVIQGGEILVILLVALIVFGPSRLPEMARKVGTWTAELRRAASDLRAGLEAEVGDLREVADEVRAPLKDVTDTMQDARRSLDDAARPTGWVGPTPSSGPTPENAMEDLRRIEETGQPAVDEPEDPATGTGG